MKTKGFFWLVACFELGMADTNAIRNLDTSAGPRFVSRPNPLSANGEHSSTEIAYVPGKGPSFRDMLQALNPLQNLPIVGQIYRAVTGATIDPVARTLGGFIYGGPIGLASAVFNSVVEDSTGNDVGGHMLAMVGLGEKHSGPRPPGPPPVELVASATPDRGSGGMLQSWIAGGDSFAAQPGSPANPSQAASAPPSRPTAVSNASFGSNEPAPAPETAPRGLFEQSRPTSGSGRGLAEYRQSAIVDFGVAARMPTPVDQIGFNLRAETSRQLADARREAAIGQNVPAALKAQEVVGASGELAETQTYFAAQMAQGLERYKAMQRQRAMATTPGI